MRLTACLAKRNPRAPQNEKKVPFKELTPLSLKDSIKGRSSAAKGNNCLYEMSLLFACMQASHFDNNSCKEQFNNFSSCIKEYEANMKYQKHLQQVGIPTPDTTSFTGSQLTYLLKKFPTK
ncbi:small ribosomal subunit protein mS37 [Augochlora pura]